MFDMLYINISFFKQNLQTQLQTPELANPPIDEMVHKDEKENPHQMQEHEKGNHIDTPLTANGVLPLSHPRDEEPSPAQVMWRGEAMRPIFSIPELATEIKTIELVIAYCRANLTWIYSTVLNAIPNQKESTVKITLLSKCGEEANLPQFIDDHRIKDVNLMKLPNVGGCDYAYAHFINYYISKANLVDADSSLILFIKDTPRTTENFHFPHHSSYRTVSEMIKIASAGEFSCGIKTACDTSPYHDTKILNSFDIPKYVRISDKNNGVAKDSMINFNVHGYKHLQNFHKRALNWQFPNNNLTQVCYGGTFAVPASRIIFLSNDPNERHTFKLIEENLARTDTASSVEEHYIERTWAGILANSLNEKDVALVRGMQRNTKDSLVLRHGSIWGALLGQNNLTCKKN